MPLALVDVVLVAGSFVVLLFVRFDGDIPSPYQARLFELLSVIVLVQLGANLAWGLYGQIWKHASVAEARRIAFAGASAGAVTFLLNPTRALPVPRSVALLGAFLATALMGAARFQGRLRRRGGAATDGDGAAARVAVVGAGEAGASIVREMRRRGEGDRVPVVVVDDDPRKQGRSLSGVPVVGGTGELSAVVGRFGADEVLVAIPSADQQLINEVMEGADLAGVPLKVLPPVRDLLGDRPSVRDARDINIEDLLGRAQIATDVDGIRAVVTGATVLITGAGGSIGSEIAEQVAEMGPARLVLLDHDETHLHDLAGRLRDPAELDLTDIRDGDRVGRLMTRLRPDVVFHAAAHKHVPLLEAQPTEAVRTNVIGTDNVVGAAARVGVERLVFISSDKAVRPSNVLGRSKWLGEQLVLHHAPAGSRWCSVRFGNVLGSRGSVIPTFARQIAGGGPVTVTDPRMNRFFMSVRESVQLVLEAATLARGGEVFMLDMGEPVNILELAERMVRLSGRQVGTEIPIRFSGPRPGEKLSEDLQDPEEQAHPTPHPSIVRLTANRVDPRVLARATHDLERLVTGRHDEAAADLLVDLTSGPATGPVGIDHMAEVSGGTDGAV
ncbi:MAG TPA: nucleoside-diphosphate sugar epimerase/dehydratase [Acidimicrobiales bacterium]|nr:nucleoside-diphosphate sugar epimerase/dehydratase [Acidimicrobiales bacterium]